MESVEKVLMLRPTLVIGSVPFKPGTVAKLLEQRFNFLAMNPRSLQDVYADIRLLGGITRRTRQAEMLVRKMLRVFRVIERKAGKLRQRPRVYCEAWPNPRISSPPWVAELVEIAGGKLVIPAGEKVSEKQVCDAQPEVIVLAWAATGDKAKPRKTYQVPEWQDVPAIRQRRVFVVRDELLNTPGPPLITGAKELWRVLHKKKK
jgi:iron complex transport system substrate-binding protein